MPIFSAIVIFVLVWWMVFFCALPFGIKNIEKPVHGNMHGAPINPGLKKKLQITTLIAIAVWLAIYAVIRSDLISFHDIAQKMAM